MHYKKMYYRTSYICMDEWKYILNRESQFSRIGYDMLESHNVKVNIRIHFSSVDDFQMETLAIRFNTSYSQPTQ